MLQEGSFTESSEKLQFPEENIDNMRTKMKYSVPKKEAFVKEKGIGIIVSKPERIHKYRGVKMENEKDCPTIFWNPYNSDFKRTETSFYNEKTGILSTSKEQTKRTENIVNTNNYRKMNPVLLKGIADCVRSSNNILGLNIKRKIRKKLKKIEKPKKVIKNPKIPKQRKGLSRTAIYYSKKGKIKNNVPTGKILVTPKVIPRNNFRKDSIVAIQNEVKVLKNLNTARWTDEANNQLDGIIKTLENLSVMIVRTKISETEIGDIISVENSKIQHLFTLAVKEMALMRKNNSRSTQKRISINKRVRV